MADNTTEIRTETVTLQVSDGTRMPSYVARPAGQGNGRGLLVFQEAFGVNSHIRDVTERFAREGYVAIAPTLFHRTDASFEGSYTDFGAVMPHMQAVTDEGLTADVQAAYQWVTGDGGTQIVATIGYCMGGRASFLADAVLPVQAAVSYYGGGIAPMPARNNPGLLERTANLHAPILLVWGGKDTHIPPEQIRQVEDALIQAGKPYDNVVFSEADHGFFCDERASFNPEASREAWALTLAFFDNHLAGQ